MNQDPEIHGKMPFPPINLIRKKPKQLKKVLRILKVATMWKVTEQNSLPIIPRGRRPQRFVLGTIVTTGNTHGSHILEPLVELGLRKLENEKRLPKIQKKSWYALEYFKGT